MITNEKISLNDTVVQGEGNIVSDMGREKVMLSIDKGNYYNLGEIGGEIWELLNEPIAVHQVIAILFSRFEVEKKECEEQVISFLNHLYKEGLIEFAIDKL